MASAASAALKPHAPESKTASLVPHSPCSAAPNALPASAQPARAGRAANKPAAINAPATAPDANTMGAKPANADIVSAATPAGTGPSAPTSPRSASNGIQHQVTMIAGLEKIGKSRSESARVSGPASSVAHIAATMATAAACDASRMNVNAASAASAPLKP